MVIDAADGAVLTRFNEIAPDHVAGSGLDSNGETRPLDVWREDGTYYLVDTSKPMYDPNSDPPSPAATRGAITVLDARNQPPSDRPETVPDLFYVTAPSPTGWQVPEGVGAAFGLAQVYDYYLERHQRNSLDGAGGGIEAVVRFGAGFQNAFWNGSEMYFGDGENYAGSLDVVAHELTHGVTQYTANLVYEDQPGALNEALSDIFGSAVEAYAFGATDWLHGSQLSAPDRNLADPGSIAICDGCPAYLSRMSEFFGPGNATLDRFVNRDNGGVHINSSIVNHAFYLLAEGLDDALGIAPAERIFYRALGAHLLANSQFVDARLACLASARELFGAGSREEQRTAQAFDAVEIFDGRGTPMPNPFPPVNGADATLFLFWDASLEAYALGRREAGLGDGDGGVRLVGSPVAAARPAVVGDGSFAVYVSADRDVCFVNTDGTPVDPASGSVEQCLGFPGQISTVAMSPDGARFGFVFLDAAGDPDNQISVIDLDTSETRTFTLRAPVFDGTVGDEIVSAGGMDFTADGATLVYEAQNRLSLVDGSRVDAWSIYALDLAGETTLALVPPVPGLDVANPALSQTSDNVLVFDVYDAARNASTVVAANLTSGELGEIGTVAGGLGVPGYSGDDGAVVYSQPSDTPTEFSLVRQPVAADRLTAQGAATAWQADADFGVVYRRGAFVGPGGCAGDCNGDAAVTIDELVKSVSIALGSAAPAVCAAVDADGDGQVTIAELVRAVNAALGGC
ncbi:MAG: M4 family metallopeptidase [Candidatus Binatia bacterium]